MARLSGNVSPTYPLASLLLGLGASLHVPHPVTYFALVFIMAALAVLRILLSVRFDVFYDHHPRRWRWLFGGSLISIGVLWGLQLCWALAERGLHGATIFGLLFSTVMVGLALNTLTPNLTLTRSFVSVVLVLTATGFAMTGGKIETLTALFLVPYGYHLWRLSRRLYGDYWKRMIQTEVSALRSAEHARERDRLQQIRRNLEDEVEKRAADYRRIFESAHDAILVFEPDREIVLDANQRACEIYGFSRFELVGMSMFDISKDAQRHRKHIERTLECGEPYHFETTQYHRDGHEIVLEVSASVVEFQGRRSIISINRDVTARKLAEDELARHRRDLEELVAERTVDLQQALRILEEQNAELEAKASELERFTYTISHDLKSPLITIRGFLGMVEKAIESGRTERAKSDIQRVRGAALKMTQLLDELLELSRIGRVVHPPEPVPLGDLAREVVELLDGSIRERGVTVEIADDLPVVHGDRVRLREVIQNLVENAVKFMGDQESPRLEIGTRDDGEGLVCFVRDNGIGIDPSFQERVFGLFERLDPESKGGVGVGLTLVRRIIEVHNGRIWVESEGVGQGSTFAFTLPYIQPEDHEPAATVIGLP